MDRTKKKILIIDDEDPILKMYSLVLDKDYEVLLAADGQEGLKIAQEKNPDLIFLDIIMPEINGLDILKKLKEGQATEKIPVVLLTNLPAEASKDKAMSLGADDYLVKVDNEPDQILSYVQKKI